MASFPNLLDGYVALDIETADSANSAPCSIAYVIMLNHKAIEAKQFLINPEVPFNPISVRIHKITPEIVNDAPTLPQIWPEIFAVISKYPVVCHNATYDISVLQKAATRYGLDFPSVRAFCTMKLSQKYLSLAKFRLYDVCNHLGFPVKNHHVALEDAYGCANIMDFFLQQNINLTGSDSLFSCTPDIINTLDEFEKQLLSEILSIVQDADFDTEMLRVSKSTFLDLCYYYTSIRFGKLKKGYYLLTREQIDSSDRLTSDTTKSGNRYFLQSPKDINYLNDYIIRKITEMAASYEDYKHLVSEKTLNKHLREYYKSTYPLSKIIL